MSALGPDFASFRHCYDWPGRSGIAGRVCPADPAGHRPKVAGRPPLSVQSKRAAGASALAAVLPWWGLPQTVAFCFRLAFNLQCLDERRYEHAACQLDGL